MLAGTTQVWRRPGAEAPTSNPPSASSGPLQRTNPLGEGRSQDRFFGRYCAVGSRNSVMERLWPGTAGFSTRTVTPVLPEIITTLPNPNCPRNSFDCVWARAVRSMALGLGITAMLEAFTALFAVISAGIFIAHAVDGYRWR